MQRPMNRRRFLELSASITAFVTLGGAFENNSPLVCEIIYDTLLTIPANGSTSNYNDSTIIQWDADNSTNQQWQLIPAS